MLVGPAASYERMPTVPPDLSGRDSELLSRRRHGTALRTGADRSANSCSDKRGTDQNAHRRRWIQRKIAGGQFTTIRSSQSRAIALNSSDRGRWIFRLSKYDGLVSKTDPDAGSFADLERQR